MARITGHFYSVCTANDVYQRLFYQMEVEVESQAAAYTASSRVQVRAHIVRAVGSPVPRQHLPPRRVSALVNC